MAGLLSVWRSMFWIAENVKTFLIDSMHTWKVELSSSDERLEVIHIRKRDIFQGCLFVDDFINIGVKKINSSLILRRYLRLPSSFYARLEIV